MKKTIYGIAILILLLVGFQNCGDGFRVANTSYNASTSYCSAIAAATKPPLPSPLIRNKDKEIATKMDVTSFEDRWTTESTTKQVIRNELLAANQRVSIAVDSDCWLERASSDTSTEGLLSRDLHILKRHSGMSKINHHQIELPYAITLEELETKAQEDKCVVRVSKYSEGTILQGGFSTLSGPNDVRYAEQKYMQSLSHKEAYSFFFPAAAPTTEDIVIAVIDPFGVDILHEDLQAHIWNNPIEATNGLNGIDDDGNGYVDDFHGYNFMGRSGTYNVTASHGTYIAGFVAAVGNNAKGISGAMAQNVRIMVLQAASSNDVNDAFRYAADMGADITVISMSLASSETLRETLEYSVAKGVTIFAAAGNAGNNTVFSPASYAKHINGVIAVGSTDGNPAKIGEICAESSWDPSFVIGAPGCDTTHPTLGILSTWGDPNGQTHNHYDYNHGTSFAAPLAAGAAAAALHYVRAHYQCDLSPAQLEALLVEGSKTHSSLQSFFKNGKHVNFTTLKESILNLF